MGIAVMVLGWLGVAIGGALMLASGGALVGVGGLALFDAGAGMIGLGLTLVGLGAVAHAVARNGERLDAIIRLLRKPAQPEPPKAEHAAWPHDTARRDLNW